MIVPYWSPRYGWVNNSIDSVLEGRPVWSRSNGLPVRRTGPTSHNCGVSGSGPWRALRPNPRLVTVPAEAGPAPSCRVRQRLIRYTNHLSMTPRVARWSEDREDVRTCRSQPRSIRQDEHARVSNISEDGRSPEGHDDETEEQERQGVFRSGLGA